MQAIVETIFDVFYLTFVISLGLKMLIKSKGNKEALLFGIMAVTLGFGDSFHLVPRMIALNTTGLADYAVMLGIGKLITSITMTAFYVILYYNWRIRYNIKEQKNLSIVIYVLALTRIVLCLLPGNEWTSLNAPISYGIYRNIPFLILGLIIIYLFYKSSRANNDKIYHNMWLTIVFSFAFYIPVVLFADQVPLIGMLMIPKTISYVFTVIIGYSGVKEALK